MGRGLRASVQLVFFAAFVALAVISFERREWYAWLFLALAAMYAAIAVDRLRRSYR